MKSKFVEIGCGSYLVDVCNQKFMNIVNEQKLRLTQSKNSNNIAILMVGKLREFCFDDEILNGYKLLINSLKEIGKKPVIFAKVNLDNSFKKCHIRGYYTRKYNISANRLNYLASKLNSTEENFKNRLKELNCESFYEIYTDKDFDNYLDYSRNFDAHCIRTHLNEFGLNLFNEKIKIIEDPKTKPQDIKLTTHYPQIVLHSDCMKQKAKYEIENDMIFNQIILTRPDLLIKRNRRMFQLKWDYVGTKKDWMRIFPSYLYNPFSEERMGIMGILYLISEYLYENKLENNPSRSQIRHCLEKNFFRLNRLIGLKQEYFPAISIKIKRLNEFF